MHILARGIKLPNVASVQCSQYANARHHGGPVEFDDNEQGFDRGLPLIEQLLGLGKLLELDDFSSNRHPALSFCLSMIFFGKPVPTFPDHAPDIVRGVLEGPA